MAAISRPRPWARRRSGLVVLLGGLACSSCGLVAPRSMVAERISLPGPPPASEGPVDDPPALPGARLADPIPLTDPVMLAPRPIPEPAAAQVPEAGRSHPAATAAVELAHPGSLEEVVAGCEQKYATIRTYRVTMTRRERVGGAMLPEETIVLECRREPFSLHLTWRDAAHQGREVVYVQGHFENKIQILLGDVIGKPRLAIAPDSPLVRRNSRHPITAMGIGSVIETLHRLVHAAEAPGGAEESAELAGTETRGESNRPVIHIIEHLARGETRDLDIDPALRLPVAFEGRDAKGSLFETYRFRDYQLNQPALASDREFDPNVLWGPSKGLLNW